jgi:hydroxymethylbilane synthase
LGVDDPAVHPLDSEVMLPAVAQGVVAIEARMADAATCALLARVAHGPTAACASAERAMLAILDGSCRTPIAGYAIMQEDGLWMRGLVASLDGRRIERAERRGAPADAPAIGRDLGLELRSRVGPGFFGT